VTTASQPAAYAITLPNAVFVSAMMVRIRYARSIKADYPWNGGNTAPAPYGQQVGSGYESLAVQWAHRGYTSAWAYPANWQGVAQYGSGAQWDTLSQKTIHSTGPIPATSYPGPLTDFAIWEFLAVGPQTLPTPIPD
jgi:hypothetical protein